MLRHGLAKHAAQLSVGRTKLFNRSMGHTLVVGPRVSTRHCRCEGNIVWAMDQDRGRDLGADQGVDRGVDRDRSARMHAVHRSVSAAPITERDSIES